MSACQAGSMGRRRALSASQPAMHVQQQQQQGHHQRQQQAAHFQRISTSWASQLLLSLEP